jgi:hypothetical protein
VHPTAKHFVHIAYRKRYVVEPDARLRKLQQKQVMMPSARRTAQK